MRALVLGGEGMLGHKMVQVLADRLGDVCCSIRGELRDPFFVPISLYRRIQVIERLDVSDNRQLEGVLGEVRPATIVNCVGVIKQRSEAQLPIPSIALNALLPHQLAKIAGAWGGRLIHFSTDCVFSGRKGSYTEDDPSDAEDLYGKTKYLGEVRAENALTLRTSIIGRELRDFQSLLEWFLSQRGKTVRGFARHLYSGVTTNHLAGLVAELIQKRSEIAGLYQLASETITKHDLLRALRDAFRIDVEIVRDESTACDRSLVGERFRAATGHTVPSWTELARELADDPTPYQEWR